MDPAYPVHLDEHNHSHNNRRLTNSGVPATETLLNPSLVLAESPGVALDTSNPGESLGLASRARFSPTPLPATTFLPAHSSLVRSTLSPLIPETVLDAFWLDTPQKSTQDHQLLRTGPAATYSGLARPASPPPNAQTGSMSTVALQYDSTFDMAGRAPFTWPVMENGNMLGHDLGPYTSDVSLTPPTYSRSVTGSPPKMLTAEQRELKRQRDLARRDSKVSQRQRRPGSGSAYASSPPIPMTELTTGATNLPIYATAPSQMPMITDPTPSLAPHQYMPAYSPSMDSHYSNQYSPQPYMYSNNYPTAAGPTLPPHYGRPTIGDPTMMYQPTPPAMVSGVAESQADAHVRVVQSRPKPQCWEHGCNGRQFSTFSNLLRHQREKSGQATKSTCPNCGAEFTRTTARNGHLLHDKCKGKRDNTSGIGSDSGSKSQ